MAKLGNYGLSPSGIESTIALKAASGYDFSHAVANPASDEEILKKNPALYKAIKIASGPYILPLKEKKPVPVQPYIDDYTDFVSNTGIQIKVGPSSPRKPHQANPELMDRVEKATEKNVQLQNQSVSFGMDYRYRLYCTRCGASLSLTINQVKEVKVVHDDIVVFAIKHRHDGGGGSLKVLSTFANVVAIETSSAMPEKVGRVFREDD